MSVIENMKEQTILDERKSKIMEAIVNEYIATAQPVSSELIQKKYKLGVSSATIRNEMMELEEMGLIFHPYTSAGRVPTDLGYRFYVDYLMETEELPREEREKIRREYRFIPVELEELINHTCKLLSRLTSYTSLATAPRLEESLIENIHATALESERILLTIATNTGRVEHRIVSLSSPIRESELRRLNKILNDRLQGISINAIKGRLIQDLMEEFSEFAESHLSLLKRIIRSLVYGWEERVFVDGTNYILEQPEFRDLKKLRAIWELLQEEMTLFQLLRKALGQRKVTIIIGSESKFEPLCDCSVVATSYTLGSGTAGILGIVGPKRLRYSQAVPAVQFIARSLEEVFSR